MGAEARPRILRWAVSMAVCTLSISVVTLPAWGSDAEAPPSHFKISEAGVRLERWSYSEKCPIYTIVVTGAGKGSCRCVSWSGDEVLTQNKFSVREREFLSLLEAFYAAYFFDLKDEYRGTTRLEVMPDGSVRAWTELRFSTPGVMHTFEVWMGDYRKVVITHTRDFRPEVLDVLEARIDSLASGCVLQNDSE